MVFQNKGYEIRLGVPSTAECYGLTEDGQEELDIVEQMTVSRGCLGDCVEYRI